jgi:hypothetical protein
MLFPCGHALAVLYHASLDVTPYIKTLWAINNLMDIYRLKVKAVNIDSNRNMVKIAAPTPIVPIQISHIPVDPSTKIRLPPTKARGKAP